ncbi:MAG TPA: vWA domain-containing protein [Burkholderiaceae bacterium]|nr:vWA domain-containing protein [Burkholderiaceae bacterium]
MNTQARRSSLRARMALLAAALFCAAPAALLAQIRPLLIEGKKTLYERVLTRPGAMLSASAGATGGKALPTFTMFYVYEKSAAPSGGNWLKVGPSTDGSGLAFVKAEDTVPWRHTIVAAFANPTDRDRLLFFRTREGLTSAINAEPAALDKLRQSVADKAALPADSPLIAAEPANWVDLQKQFYLLPVLEAPMTVNRQGFKIRTVRVASVLRDGAAARPPAAATEEGITNFKSAVVFVIDATSSMQPYIDRTRKAMEEILQQTEQAKVADRIRFGLTAFQDDPAKTRGMEYLTKVFVDPNDRLGRDEFLKAIAKVRATPNSTRAYAEDAYAALDQAARSLDWKRFGGRYLVFVTDASAREGGSPLASTRLATDQVRVQLQEQGIATYVMHLKTGEGRKDHAVAEEQYRRLSNWPGRGPLYFPVEAGDPAKFEADVGRLARALVEQVKAPQALLKPPAPPRTPATGAPPPAKTAAADGDALEASARAVGRAMVLAYLGREQATQANAMYEAWAADRDLRRPDTASLSIRVLLTKNQLSDLQTTLRKLVETGERQQIEGGNFFNQLRSVAVAMGRDPSRIAQGPVRNLEEAGLMGEYLDGLPYRSDLMALDQNRWAELGVGGTQAVIDRLKSKIALYQRFHDDVDRWVKLNDAAGDGDRVYPVPIDALP